MNDIIIERISKSYGEKVVLRDFSARIAGGTCVCIMGSSGCGKTTLANIILGLQQADSGTVTANNCKISAVFQEDRLCENFSAITNVALVCAGKRKTTAAAVLSELGLSEELNKPVCELSGGMKRRVAIARALAADGEVILMDEPFKGLDEDTRRSVISAVKRHTVGITVIIITHDSVEAELMSASIINM